ncbi:hypothetical protein [uncultured Sunxiuqinia sp.]|uniref:hypothetical protein n=1 Tax=uncultured Sunxiuqinia sp. TaxID=1573825 RepID=UPI0030D81259|tara:strand:- start:22005 stop:22946 length:942 start_codon:yes stop_codon:yes gene_type:complete
MSKSIEEEVQEVLNQTTDKVEFEEPLDPQSSPLNQPVVENEIGHTKPESKKESVKEAVPKAKEPVAAVQEIEEEEANPTKEEELNFKDNETDNVPEQEIGSSTYNEQLEEELSNDEGENFELPSGHARQAADTILGMTDNIMAVGGGFFIKIKKHKEFYDFEEVIQVIEEQNEKNIRRLKLDEEDKILLRPLLISMLKRKAKKLTPEQQLLGAVLSILMKKAQVVMEIKAENEILVERILDVIREEKGYSDQDLDEEEPEPTPEPPKPEPKKVVVAEPEEEIEEVEVEQEEVNPLKNAIMEVAEDENNSSDKK